MTPPDPARRPAPDLPLARSLSRERAFHDTCRAALAAMVDGAEEQAVTGEDVSASGADAEVLGYQLRSQAKEMRELPQGPLFFGRLDFQDSVAAAGDHAGQSYHIGRLRIREHPAAPPLVVDWRAPVSRAFYQAGARDPQGVAVRRRFGWAPGSRGDSADLTGLEDEPIGVERPSPGAVPPGLTGSGAEVGAGAGEGGAVVSGTGQGSSILAEEIERPRVGPMRDIAATIQPEQDDLVRADLSASVCVQGAPGTGKTAVGLHRAAYLLYTHPQRVRRGGLLILGPNRTFLSYIAEVLPALEETGVRQSTIGEEIAGRPVTGEDDERAAAVKHDARMARVLRRALYGNIGVPAEDLAVPDGTYRWRVPVAVLRRIVDDVRAEEPPYAVGRERVRTRVVRYVRARAELRAGPQTNAWAQGISRAQPVGAYVDAVWPRVRPEELLTRLLADAGALERVAGDPRRRGAEGGPVGAAASVVEVGAVVGRRPGPARRDRRAGRTPRGIRPLGDRRGAGPVADGVPGHRTAGSFGSLTVLGDLAQGTTPWAAREWGELLAHLGKPDAAVVPLTVGFRVPGVIVELANRVLERLDVGVPPARSLRGDGALRIRPTSDPSAETVAAVREALAHEGSIGVITADADLAKVREALDAAGIHAAGADEPGARIAVLPASLAKGLEYDHVVAVEPAAMAEAEARGLHRLYVVLTRAVSRLDVIHARPLPW
ncbi:HelD family protein [Streptomyces sp. NBC_00151]|uniref:HelD family protein n=1 Tax=Streptomyces sp. NBC_00151 TaxID=2975669 RepID=UPI003FA374CE